ncbi:histidine kinase [Amycolatopsis mediterranei]|uniref:sensor histidine kinase n=1 Tax=Amycolatopsis mediterranei TaxID=33910 RepID=UPI00341B769F
MRVADEQTLATPPRAFGDQLLRPFLTLFAIGGTVVQWHAVLAPGVALPVFIVACTSAITTLFPLRRLPTGWHVTLLSIAMLSGSVLLPLTHQTTSGPFFAYLAAGAAGGRLASRRIALGIAVAGAVVAAVLTAVTGALAPAAAPWPWWLALTVALPVYIGVAQRDRSVALGLAERGRIAREIHDVLGHSLSGIALQLDMAEALRESGRGEQADAAVRKARALAVDSMAETRRAVHALRQGALPLKDSLRALTEDVTISGPVRDVGTEVAHTVLRTAQEAVTNAAKHAPGAKVSVRLVCRKDGLRLTVHNGPATEERTDLAGGSGLGLVGMRERAALHGGTLEAGPDGDGWTVELELPR